MAEQVKKPLKITETVLRDAHQSLIATRMTTEQMLPIVDKMDQVGFHAVECWGGATFDASLRFLKEDPWERLRKLRAGFKNTKLQMLFRGQNILGYNHYADDVVDTSFTGFADCDNERMYVKNGKVDTTYTSVEQDGADWVYVKNGHVKNDYTGFAENENG